VSVNYKKSGKTGTLILDQDKARDLATGIGQSTAGALMSGERRTMKVMAGIPDKQKAAMNPYNGYGAPDAGDAGGIVNPESRPQATDNPDSDPLQRDQVMRQSILAKLSS
jgi:hypothetical protein